MTNVKVLAAHDGCHHHFPFRCNYQGCARQIVAHPFVRRYITARNTKTKYYHLECATLLRLI